MDEAIDRSSILHGEVKVDSAGTFACEGAQATKEARRVMDEVGLTLKRHEAQQFTSELAEEADLVLAVAKEQMEHMEVMAPEQTEKMHTLLGYVHGVYGDPPGMEYDIVDPFDEDMDVYRECLAQLQDGVHLLVKKLEDELSRDGGR